MIFIDFLLKDKFFLKVFGFLGKQKGGFLYFCAPFFSASWSFKAAHQSAAHKNSLDEEAI